MHRILEKQIKQSFGERFTVPAEWTAFLELVSDTYAHLDEDRALLKRPCEISLKECLRNNQHIKKSKEEVEKSIKERTGSLERYQDLVNNLSVGVYRNTLGPQGYFLEANPAIVSLFEADSKEEFMKHSVSDLYQDPARRAKFVRKVMKYGSVKNEKLDLITLKGKKLICSVSAVMKKNKDGDVYIDGLVDDITGQKKTEEDLRSARDELETRVEERTRTLQKTNNELKAEISQRKQVEGELKQINNELEDSKKAINNVLEDLHLEKTNTEKEKAKDEAILASIADGCVAVNENGEIILINQVAQKMLGCTSNESIGKQWYEILRREDESGNLIPPEKGAVRAALSTAATTTTNTTTIASPYYLRKDGTRFPVSRTVSPITLQGEVIGAVNIFRDITREKEIDKAKTEFISIASHQLRTPLTTVNWYAEMLLAGDTGKIDPEQKKYLDEIHRGSRRMVELINALLNVARLELGTFVIEPEPTDVIKLAEGVIDEHKPQINSKKIIFSSSFEKDIPMIPADPKLLHMVIQNILSNAVKYTPENGKIKLSVSLTDSPSSRQGGTANGQNKKNILLKISDTGYGIPKKQQEQIFTKLFRADNVREKDNDGTGLGLYIAKSIIEHSGGNIWFESPSPVAFDKAMAGKKENKGTTFYVTVPFEGMKKKKGSKILA